MGGTLLLRCMRVCVHVCVWTRTKRNGDLDQPNPETRLWIWTKMEIPSIRLCGR